MLIANGRIQVRFAIFIVGLLLGTASAQHFDRDRLGAAIEKLAKEIPANSLQLPKNSEVGNPPAIISEAGVDFAEAWKLYHSVIPNRSNDAPFPRKDGKDLINANKEWEKFEDLLRRTIEADSPPDLLDYERFTYSSFDWCGDGVMNFSYRYKLGLALAMMRHGKTLDALQLLESVGSPATSLLLPAFGIDHESFKIGRWLIAKSSPDLICTTGGEKTARMLMDWIDLHFDTELRRRKLQEQTNRYEKPEEEPFFPRTEILQLLRPDNGVTDATKARIIAHIMTKGITLTPVRDWLNRIPKGSENWMMPIVRLGLEDPLNVVRKRSVAILTAAGVKHTAPTLDPDLRFRILFNGEKCSERFVNQTPLSLTIHSEKGNVECSRKNFRDGIATFDTDEFDRSLKVNRGEVYIYPTLWGKIDLPFDLEKIGIIRIDKQKLTINPIFPHWPATPEDRTYTVELDRFEEGHSTDGSLSSRTIQNQGPSIYLNVSPGEYWLRILHPGVALEDRRRITIKKGDELIRPHLKKGSSLVVPVEWPELSDPEKLPPELGRYFVGLRGNWHESLQSVITIKGAGVRGDRKYIDTPEAAKGRFPKSVIFPYLPPGKYIIESPARTIEPRSIHPGCIIQPTSFEVEIREESPEFLVTKPLKILYSEKK
jgi:hypothetical protein